MSMSGNYQPSFRRVQTKTWPHPIGAATFAELTQRAFRPEAVFLLCHTTGFGADQTRTFFGITVGLTPYRGPMP